MPDDEQLSSDDKTLKSTPNHGSSEAEAPTPGSVWLCRRVAQIPLGETLQLEHHWLMTANREAGMGKCGAGVPGNRSDSPYFTETCVNDHSGEHLDEAAACEPMDSVDPSCVEEELADGRALGVWTLTNQCQSFVQEVLDKCRGPETDLDAAEGAPSE